MKFQGPIVSRLPGDVAVTRAVRWNEPVSRRRCYWFKSQGFPTNLQELIGIGMVRDTKERGGDQLLWTSCLEIRASKQPRPTTDRPTEWPAFVPLSPSLVQLAFYSYNRWLKV